MRNYWRRPLSFSGLPRSRPAGSRRISSRIRAWPRRIIERIANMESIVAFSKWLKATKLSWFVINYAWVWPASETLHFIGLAMLVGVIALVDLRLLGMAK